MLKNIALALTFAVSWAAEDADVAVDLEKAALGALDNLLNKPDECCPRACPAF